MGVGVAIMDWGGGERYGTFLKYVRGRGYV